jgi:phospholipid transport system substrate-binding protein
MFALVRRATAAAALFLAFAGAAFAQDAAPDLLVKNVTTEVIDILQGDKSVREDRSKVIQLIETKVLPHFNFQAMTASAVGRSWEKANADQKGRLIEEFKTLLVRTYASALAAYSSQKFDFRPLRSKPTDTDVTVNVRVMQPGAQPMTLDYDMEKRPDGWKVWDVRVGGISLVSNYRTEFDNQVRQGGVEGLIKTLQTKNRSLERAPVGATPLPGAPKK